MVSPKSIATGLTAKWALGLIASMVLVDLDLWHVAAGM